MKKIIVFLSSFALILTLNAQAPTLKLAAHYCFDDCANIAADCGPALAKAQASPTTPKCNCGVEGKAISLYGNEYLNILDAAYKFTSSNLTVSFYFKPFATSGTREIISNNDSCGTKKRIFSIAYNAASRTVTAILKDEKRSVTLSGKIDADVCWQHVVLTREASYHRLWINGKPREAKYSSDNQRIILTSNSIVAVGKSDCHSKGIGGQFRGMIDEVRIYENLALSTNDIAKLYNRPDRIKTNNQLLFIGNELTTEVTNTCANKFNWSPANGVENPNSGVTKIKPDQAGIYDYVLRFSDTLSTCTSYDTLRITVVDPKTQPCGEIYMPNAFTPNGDGNNEAYGISNPYSIEELKEFEILDRWGGRIFQATDAFEKWDGTISGNKAQPGQYLYRIRYSCQGSEKNKIGSFVLLQ